MNPIPQSRVLAVVVNFNAGNLLQECLQSLLRQQTVVELVVLDNHSTDDSAQAAEALLGDMAQVHFLYEKHNLGFAAGVNRAVQWAESRNVPPPDFLLIMNPDCVSDESAVAQMAQALQNHPDAGIAGPLVRDSKGRVQRATVRRFPDPWRAFRTFAGLSGGVDQSADLPDKIQRVDAVSGACMMMRFDLWQRLGGMDIGYAMHCEDLDIMYRARQAGYSSLFVPEASVTHHQGESSRSRPAWVHWQKHRGMKRFFDKFQREQYSLPIRWLVALGIWARYLLTLPFQWRRR